MTTQRPPSRLKSLTATESSTGARPTTLRAVLSLAEATAVSIVIVRVWGVIADMYVCETYTSPPVGVTRQGARASRSVQTALSPVHR